MGVEPADLKIDDSCYRLRHQGGGRGSPSMPSMGSLLVGCNVLTGTDGGNRKWLSIDPDRA